LKTFNFTIVTQNLANLSHFLFGNEKKKTKPANNKRINTSCVMEKPCLCEREGRDREGGEREGEGEREREGES
jgi:hypothetical protein